MSRLFRLVALGFLIAGPRLGGAENVAFFYAIDADAKSFAKAADSQGASMRIGNRSIASCKIGDHVVYAVKMGAGCVESAISATALLTKFRCTRVITVGPVGAISPQWKPGQWGIVDSVTAYQRGTEAANGFSPSANAEYKLPPAGDSWEPSGVDWRGMRVASGEIFGASDEFHDRLAALTKADAIDMNLGGLLAACAAFEVPVTVWRIVSDRADANANAAFAKFLEDYDGAGGAWAAEWVRKLPADTADPRTHENLRKLLDGANK